MSNSAFELQQKIHATIPLSCNMQFEIKQLTDHSIHVYAPLAPNVNIHGTGFAGSIYSLAVLSGWAMCMHVMACENMVGDLVVGKAEIKYRKAVTGDIECRCALDDSQREKFTGAFKKNGKSKLELEVKVGDSENAVLIGGYFANQIRVN